MPTCFNIKFSPKTTEVFRNMVYDQDSQNQLSNLFMVVFDEFHFMNDPERGTVWEESVISCPLSVRILALSATMGNVQDIKGKIIVRCRSFEQRYYGFSQICLEPSCEDVDLTEELLFYLFATWFHALFAAFVLQQS